LVPSINFGTRSPEQTKAIHEGNQLTRSFYREFMKNAEAEERRSSGGVIEKPPVAKH